MNRLPAASPTPTTPAWMPEEPIGAQVLFVPFEQLQTSYERFRPGTVVGRSEVLSDLPIRVVPLANGRFEVIDGFKRLERWHLDGCQVIPVVVERAGSPADHKRLLLAANSPERTLNPLAEGLVVESLSTDDGEPRQIVLRENLTF